MENIEEYRADQKHDETDMGDDGEEDEMIVWSMEVVKLCSMLRLDNHKCKIPDMG